MANTIIGTVLEIGRTVQVPTKSGKEFYKRELVLDASTFDTFTGEKRENYPSFNFLQRHVEDLSSLKVGERVEVSFFISGRRYEKDGEIKYFNDVVGFKVEPYTNGSNSNQSAAPYQPPTQPQTNVNSGAYDGQQTQQAAPPQQPLKDANGDDLPF